MFTVFVIGNIASGKSTAARYLESRGGHLLDLDQVAKDLYQPGSDVLERLAQEFGDQVILDDGTLDRSALASAAFATTESVKRLNNIVHPLLIQRLADILVAPQSCAAAQASYPFYVVEISVAASFAEAFSLADCVIAVTAPLEIRRVRAIERGMSGDDFDRRAALQPTEQEICDLADVVIDNSAADDSLFRTLDAWLSEHGLVSNQGSLGL